MNMLRSIREKKGLSISQLASRAGISARVINDYEDGKQAIALPHAKLIAKALWVQIEDLMPPAGSIPPPAPEAPRQAPPTRAAQPQVVTPTSTPAPSSPAMQATPNPAQSSGTLVTQPPAQGAPLSSESRPSTRPSRSLHAPPGPITEGQMSELARIAARLEITREQLEERLGKAMSALTRPEAKDWIKRVRAMADELAPTTKVRFGQWPEGREDREATYLREQQEAGVPFMFKLFNGEQVTGAISDFTPYTITVKLDGEEEIVLRKLAIAYYRRAQEAEVASLPGTGIQPDEQSEAPPKTARARTRKSKQNAEEAVDTSREPSLGNTEHDHARDDRHQPLEKGLHSDHVGNPEIPEEDNMDEDRGV